jgi:hypothetical protein
MPYLPQRLGGRDPVSVACGASLLRGRGQAADAPANRRSGVQVPHPILHLTHNSNAAPRHSLRLQPAHLPDPQSRTSRPTPDISPDERWRIPMKTVILAALAVLSLGAGAANAQSFAHEMPPSAHHGSVK